MSLDQTLDQANALYFQGQFAESERLFDMVRAAAPDNLTATLRAAETKLLRGAYLEGWPLYERRVLTPPILEEIVFVIGLSRKGWDGRPLPNGTLLVFGEQGNGDNIMALRFLPAVARMARRILFFTRHPGLLPLIDSVLPGTTILTPETGLAGHSFDAFVLSMSLPSFLKTTTETIPQPPYLFANAARVAHWRRRLAGDGPVVGVCWKGNARNSIDPIRSIAAGEFLRAVRRRGIRLVSLMKDDGPEQIAQIAEAERPLDISAELTDWAETAAAVRALDLVVTVDTGIAHLAGALGTETLLLSRFPPYWPWGVSGERTPWYPAMRILRGRAPRRWDEPLAELAAFMAARFP